MRRLVLLAAALATSATAYAQTSNEPPKRIRSVQLTAGQACPKSSADEIVVCSPVDNPYRIPKSLRNDGPVPAQRQAWTNQVALGEQVSREAGGLPETCSPVGTGGQSGCQLQINRQWAAEERARRRADQEGISPTDATTTSTAASVQDASGPGQP